MNLVTSPYCQVCSEIQTSNHIFEECCNALLAKQILSDYTSARSTEIIDCNTQSLVKRLLFLNKDKILHPEVIKTSIIRRIDDIESIIIKKT
jgi:hypothetical protein